MVSNPAGASPVDGYSESSPAKVSKNVEKVARSLFPDEGERARFLDAITQKEGGIVAVVWLRNELVDGVFKLGARPEWLPSWIDVAAEGERPGKTPQHQEGEIYCMDLSSTFACAALSAVTCRGGVIVDVCASPGGKGIVAGRYLEPALVVGNEVIGKRTAQLISNYKRCRIDPSLVTSLDPEVLGEEVPNSANLVIVDAPCSGQSLLLKGMAAPGAFHPATIGMNERRQRRILAHSAKIVAPGGYLLYSTCTFSQEENEDNVEWFLEKFPEFSALSVPILEEYRSHRTDAPTYRLFPHYGKGAGAFCALLKRSGEAGSDVGACADSIATRLRSAWRSPTLYVSRGDAHVVRKDRRNRPRKGEKTAKSERQRARRMIRDFE